MLQMGVPFLETPFIPQRYQMITTENEKKIKHWPKYPQTFIE